MASASIESERWVEFKGLRVWYTPQLDGGGQTFGQTYVPLIRSSIGPVDSVFEWCAGPGFIGFSLLAHGLCQRLDLADVNPKAMRIARRTILENGLENRVSLFLSDCLDAIPAERKWDLVVGNPPHVNVIVPQLDWQRKTSPLIYMDPGWMTHARFYASVGRHLRPGASVIVQENAEFSSCEDFAQMISAGGLELVECLPGLEPYPDYYFVHSRLGSR